MGHLSFDDDSESNTSRARENSPGIVDRKKSALIDEPKHEKRDSGIAGLEDNSDLKILEGPKPVLLSPVDAETVLRGLGDMPVVEVSDSDVKKEDEGSETENEDAEGVITRIDELTDEEEETTKAPPTTSSSKTTPSPCIVKSKPLVSKPHKPPPTSLLDSLSRPKLAVSTPEQLNVTSPPTTPTQYHSRAPFDHSQSATFPRPHSEHAHSPLSSSMTAAGVQSKRRNARVEDIAMLVSRGELDITVSPPTPGWYRVLIHSDL